ncbi:MAG: hypothetical protein KI793_23700 [Rivularia sp. (in: Bacteria)]|nr:hypothetical protein [Rivularia sp. MS3]
MKSPITTKQKCNKLIDKTYQNNTDSDYTEKIEELSKSFKYSDNSNHYWSEPEQSLLYGSPLYEEASPSQKLALNHLHWFTNYNYISDSETETVNLNQVTSSVFQAISGYETLSEELSFETEQEYHHINAFRKIGLMSANALIGKKGLSALFKWNSYKSALGHDTLTTYKYYGLRSIAKSMSGDKKREYSAYLQNLEQKNKYILKAPTTGMLGRSLEYSLPLQSFFSFNWGSGSPFMACQFYTIRIIANLYLKNMEHSIAKYFKKLEKNGEFIPSPTAVSRYHFLDESFHTTISQLLAKDMYKAFAKPTAYEKFVGNMAIYMMQRGTLGGLSSVLPHRYFADDSMIMELVYQLLQAPIFGMSSQEALDWMEKCFCQEHEGLQVASKNRQRLLEEMRRFFVNIDYLWTTNREMRLMASLGSIDRAVRNNKETFRHFSQSVMA